MKTQWWILVVGSLLILVACLTAQSKRAQSRIVKVGSFDHGLPNFFTHTEGWAPRRGGGLVKTKDGGATWMTVAAPLVTTDSNEELRGAFFLSASAAWLLVAPVSDLSPEEHGHLFRTMDGGMRWNEQALPRADWTMETLFARLEGDLVWLGGQRPISTNIVPASVECAQLVGGTVWSPVIFYKADSGAEWSQQTLPVENGCPVTIIRFVNEKRGVAVSQNSVFYTDDSGTHWRESEMATSRTNESWHKAAVGRPETLFFLEGSDKVAWLSYQEGAIFKTIDGGKHWRQIVKNGDFGATTGGFGAWGAFYFATEKVGWTLEGTREVFETRDGGSTWSKLDAPEHLTGLSGAQGMCWVTGDRELYRIEWR